MPKTKKRPSKFDFKPFSDQQKRLIHWWRPAALSSENNYVIADGSIRSGKTIACIIGFLTWTQEMFDGESFILAGKTMGALKKNVIRPMLQILEAWGWSYAYIRSGTDARIEIGTNTYYLYGANTEAAQDALQGLTAAGGLADEAALFPKSFIDQMIARCSVDGWKIWLNCNPVGPYHFIPEEYLKPEEMKRKKVYHLHFTMDDNLSISEKRKAEYKAAWPHGSVFYRRFILGEWCMAEGIVYDMFDEKRHVKKVSEFYNLLVDGNRYVSCDYGTQNATVFLLWNKGIDRKWYCIREYYYSGRDKNKQKTDSEYADDLISWLDDTEIKAIIVDPSAASFIAELRKRKLKVLKADNDVLDGIRMVGSLLNQERILFSASCIELRKEMTTYSWDEKAAMRGEDKPVKEHDHCMDAARYFVYTIIGNKTARIRSKTAAGLR